ncbi:MAG TPA: MFS transporter [Opitutaceae bacterium]|nr:MFS transporter [Opitutaceae bacterium]
MFRWFRPIQTQQPHASLISILAINYLWFCNLYQVFVTVNALVFTVKHFTDDPRLIALTSSIGTGFSFLIGPICNYLSDRIWTRLGRRRPFIVVGWTAVAFGMALIPFMPSYGALATLVVVYTLIGDMATPVEPLCMEVVPPEQRGRSMAVRLIMIQACLLFYFQILFPRFDDHFQISQAVPLLGGLEFTGEKMIYAIGSLLFFSAVAFALFCVRETKVPDAPNITLRELEFAPIKGARNFLTEIFADRRWWWIYLLYCSANAFLFSWTNSPLYTLLLTDQFGYTKPNIAIMSLPAMVVGVLAIMPIMGWYSDKQPRLSYPLLGALAVVGFAVPWLLRAHFEMPMDHLPNVGWLLVLGGLTTGGVACVYLMVAQFVLNRTGKAGARAWIFCVSLALQIVQAFCCWLLIRYFKGLDGAVPPILIWFIFDQLRLTLKSCTEVITSPMFFDFVPRDKMGTLSSGFGFTNSLLVFILTNTAGYWIQWNSDIGAKNYASGYLLQTIVGLIALLGVIIFLRAFRRGKILEYGRLGLSAEAQPNTVS